MEDIKTTRCTNCASEFTDQETENVYACPNCGSEGIPCSIAEDVTIKINWHELRILGIWASNYAEQKDFPQDSKKALEAILNRLEKQYPDKTPLSLASEVRQLQNEYPSATLIQGEEVIVPPKKVQ